MKFLFLLFRKTYFFAVFYAVPLLSLLMFDVSVQYWFYFLKPQKFHKITVEAKVS